MLFSQFQHEIHFFFFYCFSKSGLLKFRNIFRLFGTFNILVFTLIIFHGYGMFIYIAFLHTVVFLLSFILLRRLRFNPLQCLTLKFCPKSCLPAFLYCTNIKFRFYIQQRCLSFPNPSLLSFVPFVNLSPSEVTPKAAALAK